MLGRVGVSLIDRSLTDHPSVAPLPTHQAAKSAALVDQRLLASLPLLARWGARGPAGSTGASKLEDEDGMALAARLSAFLA